MKQRPISGIMTLVLLSILSFHERAGLWAGSTLLAAAPAGPGASSGMPQDATLTLVTHSHGDHYVPADIAKIRNARMRFLAPPDVVAAYGSGQALAPGQAVEAAGVRVTGVAAYNINKTNHPKANNWLGFLIELGGKPGQVILSPAGGADWLMADSATGVLMTQLRDAGRKSRDLVSQTVITDGQWHRVGLIWDGANRVLMVDGAEVARDTQASPVGSTGGLYLGAGAILGPGSFWVGLIDDVSIYNRAIKS